MKTDERIKIIQISDLHIGAENEDTSGIDVRKNFLNFIDVLPSHQPDMLVITGDLCFQTGQADIYRWIQKQLDKLGFPVWIISGNHDDSTLLAQNHHLEAHLKNGELFYRVDLDDYSFIFLNTAPGACSAAQYHWLETQLQKANRTPVIFMHHPPAYAGVPFMDNNYPFREMEKMQEILCAYPGNLNIFCGHYHSERTVCYKNLAIHIAPSTFFQIDHRFEDFKIKNSPPGFREIVFTKNGVETCLHFME